MLESTFEKKFRAATKAIGAVVHKTVSLSQNGFPDRMLIHDGRVVFVELKKSTGALSPVQVMTITEMVEAGANVYVVFIGGSSPSAKRKAVETGAQVIVSDDPKDAVAQCLLQ